MMTTPYEFVLTPPIEQRRVLRTAIPGPGSMAMTARKSAAVADAIPSVYPVAIDHAQGAILVDVDDNHLIDFGSGIAVTGLGHGVPEVVDAVRDQVARLAHTCFAVSPYARYIELAEKLNEITPGDGPKKTALFTSGSEAVENAVKIARRFTGRPGIVVFEHGYHGRTNLAMAMTSKNMPYKQGFGPFAPEVHRVPAADPFRWPTGPDNCLDEAFDAFVARVHSQIGEPNVAAVVAEPILGEAGFIVPPAGFIARVTEWCRRHGVLFVADEVQTGFCRTGDWFASEHEGVVPDLTVMAKGIAGGMPISAVTGRADVMDSVHLGGLGGTFGGNPVAAAAALATIAVMERIDACGAARRVESIMVPRLRALAERFDVIGDVRGRGAMIAVELVVGAGDIAPHPAMAAAVARSAHADGLLVMVTGEHKNSLRLLPPLTIDEGLLHDGLDVLATAFATAR